MAASRLPIHSHYHNAKWALWTLEQTPIPARVWVWCANLSITIMQQENDTLTQYETRKSKQYFYINWFQITFTFDALMTRHTAIMAYFSSCAKTGSTPVSSSIVIVQSITHHQFYTVQLLRSRGTLPLCQSIYLNTVHLGCKVHGFVLLKLTIQAGWPYIQSLLITTTPFCYAKNWPYICKVLTAGWTFLGWMHCNFYLLFLILLKKYLLD